MAQLSSGINVFNLEDSINNFQAGDVKAFFTNADTNFVSGMSASEKQDFIAGIIQPTTGDTGIQVYIKNKSGNNLETNWIKAYYIANEAGQSSYTIGSFSIDHTSADADGGIMLSLPWATINNKPIAGWWFGGGTYSSGSEPYAMAGLSADDIEPIRVFRIEKAMWYDNNTTELDNINDDDAAFLLNSKGLLLDGETLAHAGSGYDTFGKWNTVHFANPSAVGQINATAMNMVPYHGSNGFLMGDQDFVTYPYTRLGNGTLRWTTPTSSNTSFTFYYKEETQPSTGGGGSTSSGSSYYYGGNGIGQNYL